MTTSRTAAFTTLPRLAAALAAVLVLAACGEDPPPPEPFPFTFTVLSDNEPMAGVQFLVQGQPLPETTNEEGLVRHEIPGAQQGSITVTVVCPEGYRGSDAQTLPLVRLQSLDPATAHRGRTTTFRCQPERRDVVVIVRTNDQAGIPVMVDGAERARTDASGTAHVHMTAEPSHSFEVLLATAESHPTLSPRNPSRSFTVPDSDEVFGYLQDFETPPPPRRVRRRRPAPTPSVRLPTLISPR